MPIGDWLVASRSVIIIYDRIVTTVLRARIMLANNSQVLFQARRPCHRDEHARALRHREG
jgi:hypothetical protein